MGLSWRDLMTEVTELDIKASIHVEDEVRRLIAPVGPAEAIEVELELVETGILSRDFWEVVITFRRWDRTGGLAEEIPLVSIQQIAPRLVARVLKACIDEYEAQEASIEADFANEPDESGEYRGPGCDAGCGC
jgi:hypothetical protein